MRENPGRRIAPRIVLAITVVIGLAAWMAAPRMAAQVPQPSSSVEAQALQYPSGTSTIEAYVARPKGTSTRPAVMSCTMISG